MKFQIISDIHLEYYNVLPELNYFFNVAAPNLILAGDICYYKHHNFLTFFEKINLLYENIFFIPGNHDYYAHNEIPEIGFEQIDFIMKENLSHLKNVHFIQNDIIEYDNTIILGNTLWFQSNKTINDPRVKLLTNPYYIKFGKKCNKEIIYLGYWINGCKEMEYKKNFNSSEILINGEWIDYEKENY